MPTDVGLTLGDLGIEIEKMARDEAWAVCPNPKHPDRSASWSINLETGEHYCFSCGFGGNFLRLVKAVQDVEDDKAETWIRSRGGIGVAHKKLHGETAYTKRKAVPITEADLALYDARIPLWALEDRDLVQESCERYGVLWDPTTLSWILPVRDAFTGKLRGWQAKGKEMKNHPLGLEKADTLFGYHLLGDVGYLEESPLDCVRLDSYQVEGAVSGFGVHVSDEQMNLIVDRVDTLYVCLDNDKAGRDKEAEIWNQYRRRCRLMFANYEHTDKKDHGDMTPEEIQYSLENAVSALRYRP